MKPMPKEAAEALRKRMLGTIHIAKKQLIDRGVLTEEGYRAQLQSNFGVDSSADLNITQLNQLIDIFAKHGFKPTSKAGKKFSPTSTGKEEHDGVDKIRALWIAGGKEGWVRDPSENALNKFVRRMTGVDRVDWLYPANASKVIEALKKMQQRHQHQQQEDK